MKFFLFCILLTATFQQLIAQEPSNVKDKMGALNFMIGNWVGTSKSFENGKLISEVSAYQEIQYNLDRHIIEINLKSESLQLHTIIGYDEEDSTYFYIPFSKKGSRKLTANVENGQFIVHANATTRFVFEKTEKGFTEYGEKWMDEGWQIYFKDEFIDIQ